MSSLIMLGSIAIPIARQGVKRDRLDAVDRARAFDQTYRASVTGNPKRDFSFTTIPVPRSRADYYETILGTVTPQSCAGDIIGNNHLLLTNDLNNTASWVKSNLTITTGIADPFGGTDAVTLTATAAIGDLQQFLTASSSIARVNSVWLRRRTGTGVIDFYNPLNAASSAPVPSATWQQFSNAGGASTLRKWELVVRTSGDAIDLYGPQLENGIIASPYTLNTTVPAPVDCCSEITGWTPQSAQGGQYVTLDFTLYEV